MDETMHQLNRAALSMYEMYGTHGSPCETPEDIKIETISTLGHWQERDHWRVMQATLGAAYWGAYTKEARINFCEALLEQANWQWVFDNFPN